jgi:dipeptidase D
VAIISLQESEKSALHSILQDLTEVIKQEHATTDPNMSISMEESEKAAEAISRSQQSAFLNAIYACPNGIYRMSPDIEGLVQTSNNLARVKLEHGKYEVLCLTRSSVESEKADLVNAIEACFTNIMADVSTSGAYPGWQPKPDADIVKIMSELYRNSFKEEAHVNACHAGLECGILGQNYPDMDMISFGPNIRGAHSPDERVQISSVQKFWGFLLDTLKQIPDKQ